MPQVTLAQLLGLFADKRIRITYTRPSLKPYEGTCKTVRPTAENREYFDFEMQDGNHFGFRPQALAFDSAEGTVSHIEDSRFKIQII